MTSLLKEIDFIGPLLIIARMALFLLPFSIYSYQAEEWRSPMIIAMIIVGGLLLIAFALYEKYLAPVTFIPFEILTDRTVIAAGVIYVFVFFSLSIWFAFFTSMAQVIYGLNVRDASYVTAI